MSLLQKLPYHEEHEAHEEKLKNFVFLCVLCGESFFAVKS